MNIFKSFLMSLVTMLCFAFAMPVDAAVAVKRQPMNKSTHTGIGGSSAEKKQNTVLYAWYGISLGGAKSATFSEDAQGHSHLYVYDDMLRREVEVTPENFGFEYDEVPLEVAEYKRTHPAATYREAFQTCGIIYPEGFTPDSDTFWKNAAIYLANYEEYNPETGALISQRSQTINTVFRMTGGTVNAIIVAGLRSSNEFGHNIPQTTTADVDHGQADIFISGGNVQFVAVSVSDTKYFDGTAHIYMQNCHYTGGQIPNFYHSREYATSTIVISGVTYDNPVESAVLLTTGDYKSLATYNVLQSASGRTVRCMRNGTGAINLPAAIQPIVCDTFVVATDNVVENNAAIHAKRFAMPSMRIILGAKGNGMSLSEPTAAVLDNSSQTFTNLAGGVVNTGNVNIGSSATVYNLGTFTVCSASEYTCTGTWADRYSSGIGRYVFCNPIAYDHIWHKTGPFDNVLNPVVNLPCTRNLDRCDFCNTPGAERWSRSYAAYYIYDNAPVEYTGTTEIEFRGISYKRTFSSTNYQPLYVPFSILYASWSTKADIYKIKNIHEYDDNNDGTIDRWTLEVVKLKEGQDTKPNTPYVIRPKTTGTELTFASDRGATLYATNVPHSIDCRSTDHEFVFTGTPASKTITANSDFYLAPGGLCYGTQDVTIGTYRWYMSIYDRETGEKIIPSQFNAAKRITVFCEDDGEEVTGVFSFGEEEETVPADAVIYDLNGQKVSKMLDGKIYIVNGKKFRK